MRVVFNISGSLSWRRRPVGIVRVERELFKQIYTMEPITPVCLKQDGWYEVPKRLVSECVSDDWVNVVNPEDFPFPADRILDKFKPHHDDIFISLGSDWSFNIPDRVLEIYPNSRNLITACYDLIPLIYPEYTPGPEFFDQFSYHYERVRLTARKVFAISQVSASDLLEYWKETSPYERYPEVKPIPLAGLDVEHNINLSAQDKSLLKELNTSEGFVIFVSTLEPRKNHILLAHIWKKLFEEMGGDCPKLLFVGMMGWGSNDLLSQLSRMDATNHGKIIWKEGISDSLLKALYANCLFAVHPSNYEGWGLAATEAMSFGKVCVVSNNSAMPEATQNLVPSYHPQDFFGWLNEIRKLIVDTKYRQTLEKNIQQNFSIRTWEDFGKEFLTWVKL